MSGKLLSIHYLRAIAVIAVLLSHFTGLLIINGNPLPFFERGAFGVDLFFIISGFIIYISSNDLNKNNPKGFLIRRVFRIFPLFIFSWIIGMSFVFDSAGLWGFIKPLLLIYQNYDGAAPKFGTHAMGTPWTLAYELLFYMFFVIALIISHKYRAIICITFLVFVPVLLQLYYNGQFSVLSSVYAKVDESTPMYGLIKMLSGTIMFEFALGIIFAILFIKIKKINLTHESSSVIFYSSILISLAILITNGDSISKFGLEGYFIPSAILFLGFMARDKSATIKYNRFLDFFGNISYSLYITHFIIYVWIVKHLDRVWMEPVRGYPIVLIGMVVSVAFSWICYLYIEKPGIRLGKKFA